MKLNYVNPEHVHALVDLPTSISIEDMVQHFKGSSSHWMNQSRLIPIRFAWGRGYGVFSVSHSAVSQVAKYIANQDKHHRKRTFSEEFALLVDRYGLQWRDDKPLKTVKEASV
jgi:hypothetical protein